MNCSQWSHSDQSEETIQCIDALQQAVSNMEQVQRKFSNIKLQKATGNHYIHQIHSFASLLDVITVSIAETSYSKSHNNHTLFL